MAATTTAEVTRDTGEPVPGNYGGIRPNAYLGCLRSDGRERVLASFRFQSGDATTDAPAAAIGGDYAALIVQSLDPHYGGSASKVEVFDLRPGSLASKLGGQGVSCPDYSYTCGSGMDELVINDQGFTAVRSTIDAQEQIQVSDDGGVRTVDTSSGGSSQALTDLQLSGDTLTWKHSGVPEQTQLH